MASICIRIVCGIIFHYVIPRNIFPFPTPRRCCCTGSRSVTFIVSEYIVSVERTPVVPFRIANVMPRVVAVKPTPRRCRNISSFFDPNMNKRDTCRQNCDGGFKSSAHDVFCVVTLHICRKLKSTGLNHIKGDWATSDTAIWKDRCYYTSAFSAWRGKFHCCSPAGKELQCPTTGQIPSCVGRSALQCQNNLLAHPDGCPRPGCRNCGHALVGQLNH